MNTDGRREAIPGQLVDEAHEKSQGCHKKGQAQKHRHTTRPKNKETDRDDRGEAAPVSRTRLEIRRREVDKIHAASRKTKATESWQKAAIPETNLSVAERQRPKCGNDVGQEALEAETHRAIPPRLERDQPERGSG